MFGFVPLSSSKRFVRAPGLIVALVCCLSSIGFGQQPTAVVPEYIPPVSFSEILKGLSDESISSIFDRDRDLSRAIDNRGVGFGLSSNTRDVLVKAGASDGLLTAITRKQKERSDAIVRLYKEYGDNRNKFNVNDRQRSIAIIRELLDRIGDPELLVGDERGWSVVVKHLKEVLPNREMELKRTLTSNHDH